MTISEEDEARFMIALARSIDRGVKALGNFAARRPSDTPIDFLEHIV